MHIIFTLYTISYIYYLSTSLRIEVCFSKKKRHPESYYKTRIGTFNPIRLGRGWIRRVYLYMYIYTASPVDCKNNCPLDLLIENPY